MFGIDYTETAEDRESTDLIHAHDVLVDAGGYIGYWAVAYWVDADTLVVREQDDAREWWLRPKDVLAWLDSDGPAALIKQIGDPYQMAAVAMMKARNWDELDYDAETGDLIIQQMILDEVRYS